jgi:hypothetical protein
MFTSLVDYINNKCAIDEEYNFDKFKSEFENTNLLIKEKDDLAIVYYENMGHPITCLEQMTRSCIVDTKTMKVLVSQQNNIVYNQSADAILKEYAEYTAQSFDDMWKQHVVVQECIEGTLISLFYHNGTWHTSTRRCIDAAMSQWGSKTYREMFDELLDVDIDSHNKNHSYVYILVHNENNNIVRRNSSENKLILCSEMEVGSLTEIRQTTIRSLKYDYRTMKSELTKMDMRDRKSRTVSNEGFVVKLYEGELYKSNYMILKYQTDLYTKIAEIKPNTCDVQMILCGLYQQDKLFEYGKYITTDASLIASIPPLFKDLANKFLSVYSCTRNKKNPDFYSGLGPEFKKSLFQLHGKFVNRCMTSDTTLATESTKSVMPIKKRITIHDVYHFIKNKPFVELARMMTEYNDYGHKLEIPPY